MEIKFVNYNNEILKGIVIPLIRKGIPMLNNNVMYDFPKSNAKFPLIVCNIIDSPKDYDIGQNELTSDITINIYILAELQSTCLDLEFEVKKILLTNGFTRLSPTSPFKNTTYDKFEIDSIYKIRYNALNGALERGI